MLIELFSTLQHGTTCTTGIGLSRLLTYLPFLCPKLFWMTSFRWRGRSLVTSRHATWSCLLSVGNALSTAYLFLVFRKKDLYLVITQKLTFMKSGGFQADFMKSAGFHGFHEIWWISGEIHWQILCGFHMKSGAFYVKSTYKTYKSNISRKTLQFYGVLGKAMSYFHMKSAGFRKTNCQEW